MHSSGFFPSFFSFIFVQVVNCKVPTVFREVCSCMLVYITRREVSKKIISNQCVEDGEYFWVGLGVERHLIQYSIVVIFAMLQILLQIGLKLENIDTPMFDGIMTIATNLPSQSLLNSYHRQLPQVDLPLQRWDRASLEVMSVPP